MTAKPQDPKKFFMDHIQNDFYIIKELINVTVDDLIILLHSMCVQFVERDNRK